MTTQPDDLRAWQARIDADPDVQAVLRGPLSTYDKLKAFSATVKRKGIALPKGLTVDIKTGQVKPDHFWRDVGLGTVGMVGSAYGMDQVAQQFNKPKLSAPADPSWQDPNEPTMPSGAPSPSSGGGRNIPWGTIAKVGGTVAAPMVGRAIAGGGSNQNSGTGLDLPPELKQLLQMQLQRIQAAQPNYDLMLNMARGMQPQWARNSTSPQGAQDPQMAAIIQRLAQPRG